MLQLDAAQLYDLSEAGRLLCRDPARLRRQARLRQIPAARIEGQLGLPAPWVDAESGRAPTDPESLRTYWLARLAPPSPNARRPARDRARLPVEALLEPEEAARRLFATPRALDRLSRDGTVPPLRVDGQIRYDAVLVDLLARLDEAPAVAAEAQARQGEVLAWARFEYASSRAQPAPPAPVERPEAASNEEAAAGPAPGAYEIPADLDLEAIAPSPPSEPAPARPPKPSTLIEAEGFETVDED